MDPKDGTGYGYDTYPTVAEYGRARATGTKPRSKRELLEAKADRLRVQADRLEAKVARLEALPDEPLVDEGEPNVIWFTKVFQNGSNLYTYSAVKAGDGLWYTSGPNTPKGYLWEALIEWIADGTEYQVWWAKDFEELA